MLIAMEHKLTGSDLHPITVDEGLINDLPTIDRSAIVALEVVDDPTTSFKTNLSVLS